MLKDCTGAEKLLGVEVKRNLGRPEFTIKFEVLVDGESAERSVTLKPGVWNKGAIIAALVRAAYSQDEMEAINSNRTAFLTKVISAFVKEGPLGALNVAKEVSEESLTEFNTMQVWRATAKRWAVELITQYPVLC